jgi:hypothetical protein
MNANTLFNNEDIITELWKHVKVNSMKRLSIVSKDFNTQYKNMSNIDIIYRKYLESDSLSSYIIETGKSVSKEYGYAIPKFLNILSNFLEKKITDRSSIANDIHIIYYWIIILVHAVNNNYKGIIDTMKKIDYKRKLDKKIIQLFLDLMAKGNIYIYGPHYSANKSTLLRYVSIGHIILFSKNQFRCNKKYVNTVLEKQNMLINCIRDFEIFPGRWLHPKMFCKKFIEIFEK